MFRFLAVPVILATLLSGTALAQSRRKPLPRPGARGGAVIERLNRMTPEQRQRALDRLPAERRARVEERLQRLNSMPPAARERLRRQYDEFQKLSPDKQDAVRRAFRELNQMPEKRRRVVRREIMRTRNMPDDRRSSRFESEAFRSEFNDAEQKVIRDLADVAPPEDVQP